MFGGGAGGRGARGSHRKGQSPRCLRREAGEQTIVMFVLGRQQEKQSPSTDHRGREGVSQWGGGENINKGGHTHAAKPVAQYK